MHNKVASLLVGCCIACATQAPTIAQTTSNNPKDCKVVERTDGQKNSGLSSSVTAGGVTSSVTAGGGQVSGHTTGGNSVTVRSKDGSAMATAGTSGSGSSTTVTTADGECVIYVNPGERKDGNK